MDPAPARANRLPSGTEFCEDAVPVFCATLIVTAGWWWRPGAQVPVAVALAIGQRGCVLMGKRLRRTVVDREACRSTRMPPPPWRSTSAASNRDG